MSIGSLNTITRKIIKAALLEDIGISDITTNVAIPKMNMATAHIISNQDCILAGIDICQAVFKMLDRRVCFKYLAKDGDRIKKNQVIAKIYAKAQTILTGERVALNFVSHLSGIATITNAFVRKAGTADIHILDTRKTIPNLRALQKYAVRVGGGFNHRFNLSGQVLIKDNHIEIRKKGVKGFFIKDLINETRKKIKRTIVIEIEVGNLSQFKDAIRGCPNVIMLDNFDLDSIKEAVRLRNQINRDVLLEVSGGVTFDNIQKIAKTKVDFISVGSLTHSVKSIDFSLEIK